MDQGKSSTRKYAAPKLIKYGDMVALTATGSAGNDENQGNQGTNRLRP